MRVKIDFEGFSVTERQDFPSCKQRPAQEHPRERINPKEEADGSMESAFENTPNSIKIKIVRGHTRMVVPSCCSI